MPSHAFPALISSNYVPPHISAYVRTIKGGRINILIHGGIGEEDDMMALDEDEVAGHEETTVGEPALAAEATSHRSGRRYPFPE